MSNRATLPGESTVTQWAFSVEGTSGLLVLSNYRVWLEQEGRSRYGMTSLTIDEVQWGGLVRVHHPVLLVFAAFVMLLTLLLAQARGSSSDGAGVVFAVGALFAIFLVVAYFLTRSVELRLGSGAGLIATHVPGSQRDEAQRFISAVEQAAMQARARS
jgi:hypothetical protein